MKVKRRLFLCKKRGKARRKIINKEKELKKLKSDIKEFRRGNVVLKRGQTLFIAEVNSNPNIKLDLERFTKKQINMYNKLLSQLKKKSKIFFCGELVIFLKLKESWKRRKLGPIDQISN